MKFTFRYRTKDLEAQVAKGCQGCSILLNALTHFTDEWNAPETHGEVNFTENVATKIVFASYTGDGWTYTNRHLLIDIHCTLVSTHQPYGRVTEEYAVLRRPLFPATMGMISPISGHPFDYSLVRDLSVIDQQKRERGSYCIEAFIEGHSYAESEFVLDLKYP